jgi:hypothetical protein
MLKMPFATLKISIWEFAYQKISGRTPLFLHLLGALRVIMIITRTRGAVDDYCVRAAAKERKQNNLTRAAPRPKRHRSTYNE